MKIALVIVLSLMIVSCYWFDDYYWSYSNQYERHIKPQKTYIENYIDRMDINTIDNKRRWHRKFYFNDKIIDAEIVPVFDGLLLSLSRYV